MSKEYQREYRKNNKDKFREYDKKFYDKNKDKIKERHKANKDKIKEYSERYYLINKDKKKEKAREYYRNNREDMVEYSKRYSLNNKNKIRDKHKRYYKKNIQKIKQRYQEYKQSANGRMVARNSYNKRRAKIRQTDITTQYLIDLKNNTTHCEICSKKLKDNIHLDHIIPLNIGGTHTKLNVRYVHAKCNLQRPKNGSDIIQFKLLL